ncbi:hypothetical protein MYX76_18720, partial [Desulfobacterota bacterium AH_259_B03_O07]|nr:hypothetical protein [Desulfobacterota bacterium AH_259_B03_O07]
MNLTPENVSKRYIESWKQTYIPHKRVISPYLKGREIKAISKFFGFSNALTVSAIIDFLLNFGCNLNEFSEQHKFLFSLLKICLGEHDPNLIDRHNITPGIFYEERDKIIVNSILDMRKKGQPVGDLELREYLTQN